MSSEYDPSDPRQRPADIAEAFRTIDAFVDGFTREQFVEDRKTQLAVLRLFEEICEAAYWFLKNRNGSEIRERNPEVNFASFGSAGNVYRHQYAVVDYGIVWNDLRGSADVEALRELVRRELSR